MPRPKVPLENRKRAVQACTTCRLSKKRCNGAKPCANCVRKGAAESCVYEDLQSTHSTQPTAYTHQMQINSSPVTNMSPASGSLSHGQIHQMQSPVVGITPGTLAFSPEAPHRTHPRMLDNSYGEKVFFGGSASLAFLQLIRETVSQNLGDSDFSHPADQNFMLEGLRARALPTQEILLSPEQEREYLDTFFVVSRGIVEIYTKDQVIQILAAHRNARVLSKSLELAVAQAMVAIGAQCSLRTDLHITNSQSFFAEAQQRAFEGMIEDPSLEMVELFLLMAFYMLGASHRNAAFMYIGVAARASYALGLHYALKGPKSLTEYRSDRAKNVWKCLVTLDAMVSSIMGRPPATVAQFHKSQDESASDADTQSNISVALQANYELACLFDQKVQELYDTEKVTIESASACLDDLNDWSSRLPAELRSASTAALAPNSREQVVGGLHVSCFYYFAVMLVARPFLIVCLSNRLAKTRMRSEVVATEISEARGEPEMQEIATACLNAATFMIQTCLETQTYGFLPDNMRLLQAWVFAAGLVLGFEMFTVGHSKADIESSFHGSRKILKTLSIHSAQAAHYHEILTSLSDAIDTQRRQGPVRRKRSIRPIVDRIMAFQPPEMAREDIPVEDMPSVSSVPSAPSESTQNIGGTNDTVFPDLIPDFEFQEMMDQPFLNWDSSDFMSWDPFSRNFST